MKIAFTANGPGWDSKIDPRFGRAAFLVIFDEETNKLTSLDNRAVNNEAHGAGAATAQKIFGYKPDVLITGNGPGETASIALERLNMKIYVDAQDFTLIEAYQLYREGRLRQNN